MYLSTDGGYQTLPSGASIAATYAPADASPGSVTLQLIHATTPDVLEASLRMDPWKPGGFLLYEWAHGETIALAGDDRITLLDSNTLGLCATMLLEHGECKVRGPPWFVEGDGVLVLATETRVFCIDERKAIRWCWTVRTYSDEWLALEQAPTVAASGIKLTLRSPKRAVALRLSLTDGSPLSSSHS